MSTETATKLLTADEFYDFVHRPENANRWFELVRGEVIELPPSRKPHGFVCAKVARILCNFTFERGYGYVTSNDSGVLLERLPDTVRGPDVALYEDVTTYAELHPKYGEVPPRLAVEVLSSDDRAPAVMRKIADYLGHGVPLVWVLDPEVRTLTVHRPDAPQRLLHVTGEVTGEEILPNLRCPVADFFRLPGEKAPPG